MPKKILGLIPIRYNSKRLHGKALLYIDHLPMAVHVYRRTKMSNLLDDVIVCCENKKVYEVLKKYNCKSIFTSKNHKNGTERIAEAYKKIKKKYDLVVDIQGDEPLIDPKQIDKVIKFHLKNFSSDVVVPSLKIPLSEDHNVVKIVKDRNLNVLYDEDENPTQTINFVQNRAVIFPGHIKHKSLLNYGNNLDDGRLTLNCFFEVF